MLDPTTETGRALLEKLITQQATIIAYANDFKLMMVMTLLAFPLILLIRTAGTSRALQASPAADAAGRATRTNRAWGRPSIAARAIHDVLAAAGRRWRAIWRRA